MTGQRKGHKRKSQNDNIVFEELIQSEPGSNSAVANVNKGRSTKRKVRKITETTKASSANKNVLWTVRSTRSKKDGKIAAKGVDQQREQIEQDTL